MTFFSGFWGLAVYSGLNGFWGSGIAFIRPLVIQEMCGQVKGQSMRTQGTDKGAQEQKGNGEMRKDSIRANGHGPKTRNTKDDDTNAHKSLNGIVNTRDDKDDRDDKNDKDDRDDENDKDDRDVSNNDQIMIHGSPFDNGEVNGHKMVRCPSKYADEDEGGDDDHDNKVNNPKTKKNPSHRHDDDNDYNHPDVSADVADLASGSGDNLASLFGLFNFVVGVGIAVIPAISGSLVDAFASTAVTFPFHAGGHLVAFAAVITALWLSRRRRRRG